ncbi:hypothetical protein Mag101_07515 [Microbulbifer agarilyticus]|uniref:Tryptophan synthase beta chain-like PALP domain-containing protein n=1 Tax=Microbulbifer agarilyticus TaxID=260552 RepID=A0A1Q2M5K2_9GAMM|nr:pyridoxal-phosphate dependent enzyme [Microbulbifer agarilyticus]AQQ67502.1 hypothetical protein Mag101_07515 [Microbulbifer agarilyticus]
MVRYLTELNLNAFVDAAENVPYQQINSDLFPNLDLWVRRDDLIDPVISGNKAYKLIYNLIEARKRGKDTIVTCGGAWSNHIHATAAAGLRFGFKTIGIIRGERVREMSPMLQDAERFGMSLRFVSRSQYRHRHESNFMECVGLCKKMSWFVPEGGANNQGAMGVRLLGKIITKTSPVSFGECWVACGTGVTLGGLITSLPTKTKTVGVAVLRAKSSILKAVEELGRAAGGVAHDSWQLIDNGHQGGYAKNTKSLDAFMKQMDSMTGIGLDHVYTAKVMYSLAKRFGIRMGNGRATHLNRVLLMHSGGLQGRRGFA